VSDNGHSFKRAPLATSEDFWVFFFFSFLLLVNNKEPVVRNSITSRFDLHLCSLWPSSVTAVPGWTVYLACRLENVEYLEGQWT
jgi:hypothetical protein